MDAETYTAASTQTNVTAVSAAVTCVQLCEYNLRRVVLILSTPDAKLKAQPVPPGVNIDLTMALTAGVVFPLTSGGGGFQIFTFADHGPLVQMAWFSDLEAGPGFDKWTVIEVIDTQMPCGPPIVITPPVIIAPPPDYGRMGPPRPSPEWPNPLAGLSSGRGGDEGFSMGMGPKR